MKRLLLRLINASRWTRAIAATLLVVAAAGATDALASSGVPTSPSSAESVAAAPPTYQAPTEPLRSDSEIAGVARQAAAVASEPSPSDMRAVNTTLRSALTVNPRETLPPAPNASTEAFEKSEVVVVTMRGQFTLHTASVPAGQSAPTGSVLTLILDAHTGKIEGTELANTEAQGISALGTSRPLE